MKRILQYLTWLGDSAIEKGTVLYTLAKAAITAIDEFNGNVDAMTDQIYLKTATGEYLDRWGWDLVRLKRKYMEDDDSYRGRIIVELLRLYGTRQAIIKILTDLTGEKPVEVFEPIRDTAYNNAGIFLMPAGDNMVSAAADGSGRYVARLGSKTKDSSFTGYIRIKHTETSALSAGLFFYDADYMDAGTFTLPATRKQNLSRAEIMDAVQMIIVAGTQVYIEFLSEE